MRIDELISQGRSTISFEVTPPSDGGDALRHVEQTVHELARIQPDFLSVTYSAPGETRVRSIELAEWIHSQKHLCVLSHLACVGHDAGELADILDRLSASGIRNILALRGEAPTSISQWTASEGDFTYASELVAFIRQRHDFCIGVAGYPEGHPESSGRDLDGLKRKIDAGGCFVLTEFFFDNAEFYRFRDQVRAAGIQAPIVATLMPIIHLQQARQVVSARRVRIGDSFLRRIESAAAAADPQAVYKMGVAQSLSQCEDLLANEVQGLHFYTLNNSQAASEICQALRAASNRAAAE